MLSFRGKLVFSILLLDLLVQGLEHCKNGLICPNGNTCCNGGCIASDLGPLGGTCCDDGRTGCGSGYLCASKSFCLATSKVTDPLVQYLPRYRLCHPQPKTLETLHGFPIHPVYKLAYFSSHGDISSSTNIKDVDYIFIAIHGATRNADDYFCAASEAVALQKIYQNVLVIVPFFAAIVDGPLRLSEGGTALRWRTEEDSNGPWRYGARSTEPLQVSSFDILDRMIMSLLERTASFISIFGHSSGAQFVQRWSLLTMVDSKRWKVVVANPSSYAYLTPLRKLHGQWNKPINICSCYNEWEWGLDDSKHLDDDYKKRSIKNHTIEWTIERYRSRHVTYLIGMLDQCNVTVGWCDSHGLETSCMDEVQGSNRVERHFNFIESLASIGIDTHVRISVKGVGHDHSLMMQSPEGLFAIFGAFKTVKNQIS